MRSKNPRLKGQAAYNFRVEDVAGPFNFYEPPPQRQEFSLREYGGYEMNFTGVLVQEAISQLNLPLTVNATITDCEVTEIIPAFMPRAADECSWWGYPA